MINREDKMQALQDELEQNLDIIGCTAIEDLLQDKVGETIAFLVKSNIKVWVLTGDKVETAKSIGQACMLINNEMTEILIDGCTEVQVNQQIDEALGKFSYMQKQSSFYCMITGDALLTFKQEKLVNKVRFFRQCLLKRVYVFCQI